MTLERQLTGFCTAAFKRVRRSGARRAGSLTENVSDTQPFSVRLHAFHLNAQQDVLLETVLLPVTNPEVRAVEAAAGIGAAHLLLQHGVLKTLE